MKSSETVENKGFPAICSPNPFIKSYTVSTTPAPPISIRLREGKLSLFSRVMLEQIRTIDKSRILNRVGRADDSTMRVLNHVLSYSLDLADQESTDCHDPI